MNRSDRLDVLIADTEAKLSKLRAVRNAIEDEQISEELEAIFGSAPVPNGKKRIRKKGRPRGSTVFERLKSLFVANDNAWLTLNEIVTKGIKKPTARQLIYVGHADDFERESKPGGGRETKFRMKRQPK